MYHHNHVSVWTTETEREQKHGAWSRFRFWSNQPSCKKRVYEYVSGSVWSNQDPLRTT